jgi:hypothetical protein
MPLADAKGEKEGLVTCKLSTTAVIVIIALTLWTGIGTVEAHNGGARVGGFPGGGIHGGEFRGPGFFGGPGFRGEGFRYGNFFGRYYPGYYGFGSCYLTVYGTIDCY